MKPDKNTVEIMYNFETRMTDIYINGEYLESKTVGEFNEDDIELYLNAAEYTDMLDEIDESNK